MWKEEKEEEEKKKKEKNPAQNQTEVPPVGDDLTNSCLSPYQNESIGFCYIYQHRQNSPTEQGR